MANWRTAAATAAVLLIALLIYWQGLQGPFVLDDRPNILKAHIDTPDLAAILYTVTHNTSGLLGRNVSVLSFVLTGLQYGVEPWGYKFHNLLIHLVCGLLLFRVLFLLVAELDRSSSRRRPLIIAGVVAALWLLHPLLVSTVLYAVQRMTQLAALFMLLSLLAYLAARRRVASGRQFLWYGWVLFPLCFGLALLSKETGVLVPLYVLVVELCVFRSGRTYFLENRRFTAWLAVFVALPLLAGGLYVLTHFESLTDYSVRTFSLSERLLTEVHVVFFYARQILLPRLGAMSLFHDDFPVTSELDFATAALIVLLLGVVALIWKARWRYPILSLGLAWFLVSHVLESTFVPLELVFEHRNYLAAAGLLLPPVWAMANFAATGLARSALVACALVLCLQTWSRVQEWKSEGVMTAVAVHDHPGSVRAHTTYSNYMFAQKQYDQAQEHVAKSMMLQPKDAGAALHLIVYQCVAGIRSEDVLVEAEARLRSYPISTYALNALENILATISRKTCTVITRDDVKKLISAALSLPDNLVSIHYGYLLRFDGMHAFLIQRYAEGVIAYRQAYDVSEDISMLAELVRYQIGFGRLDDAADTLAFVEELNAAAFGTENYVVQSLHEEMAKARSPQASTAEVPPEPSLEILAQ